MRRISLLLATLTACISIGCTRASDSIQAEWQQLHNSALEKAKAGENQDAQQQFELAITKAEQGPDAMPLVKSLLALANFHIDNGQPEKSRHLLTRAHDIGQKQLNDPNTKTTFWQESTARSAHALANIYRDQGDFAQAESHYRLASEHIEGCTTESAQQIVADIASDYKQMDTNRATADIQVDDMLASGRQAGDDARMKSNHEFQKLWKKSERLENSNSPEAEAALLKVLGQAKATYGIREPNYRWTLQRLFTHYCRTEQFEKARLLFEEDLKQLGAVESITREKLENDPEYLADLHHLTVTLSRLSDIAMGQGRLKEAYGYTERAIRLRQKWGPRDLHYVYMLRKSSEQLMILCRVDEAVEQLDNARRALEDIEHQDGVTPDTEAARFQIGLSEAQIEYQQGSFKQAEKHLREARQFNPKLFQQKPELLELALLDSAKVAHDTKKFQEEKAFLAELNQMLIKYPAKNPSFSFSIHRQNGLHSIAVMNYENADIEFKRALEAAKNSKIDNHIIDAYRWCAEGARCLERFPESEKYVQMALQHSESVKNWTSAIDSALCLGLYKSTTNAPVAAEQYYKQALKWCEQYFPNRPSPCWTALSSYCDYLRRLGKNDLAFDTMKTALNLAIKNKNERPDLIVQAYINLGCLCCDRGDFDEARSYFEKAIEAYKKESVVNHSELFQLYTGWAISYWLEGNEAKAGQLFAVAAKEFKLTPDTPDSLLLSFDTETAYRYGQHRLRTYRDCNSQRLLKIAQLVSNQPTKDYLSASTLKFASYLCTLDHRDSDARSIEKIACQTRDRLRKS